MQVFQIWIWICKFFRSGRLPGQKTSRKSSRRLPGSLPDDFQEVFQTTSRKTSRRLPGSLLTESSPMSPFHNISERFGKFLCMIFLHLVFNQMVLIFHLDMFFQIWIRKSFNYNALEDFQEVFRTTYKKSSRRLPGSLPESGSLPEAGSLLPCQVESKLVFVDE
ncbi:hypothetical protein DY000_02052694 [Brassica cretica]|uniref:Uncharacterized protein n=1 Tax=Brassica cretica TaxID=69181 RepID=A0ABQ7AK08_BRACR|nr:hypothetical protein DY000_02052694 [Brassica cretica]